MNNISSVLLFAIVWHKVCLPGLVIIITRSSTSASWHCPGLLSRINLESKYMSYLEHGCQKLCQGIADRNWKAGIWPEGCIGSKNLWCWQLPEGSCAEEDMMLAFANCRRALTHFSYTRREREKKNPEKDKHLPSKAYSLKRKVYFWLIKKCLNYLRKQLISNKVKKHLTETWF